MSKEQAQQLYEEIGMLESQYASASQQESMIGNAYNEAETAAASLRGISTDTKLDTLVSVGSGILLDAHIANTAKVIINIGVGVAIKKDRAYAMNYIELRIKELGVALRNVSSRKQEIAARVRQDREQLEKLAHPVAGSAQNNV